MIKDADENLQLLPIGRPISNTSVYLFDKWMKLVPPGVAGELFLGGDGVARGYLNKPGLTEERFKRAVISHSSLVIGSSEKLSPNDRSSILSTNDQWPMTNDRLYLTGDFCRWLRDGNIEFLGRIDRQVKIRGFRIEPGEIENQLLSHECIKKAVVLESQDKIGEKYLCAYIVPTSISSIEALKSQELRNFLLEKLPEYMIPSYFIPLENIPLTASGKIDRKSLPLPMLEVDDTFVSPQDATQERLVEIWSDLLAIEKEKISIDANFFELGGHSLKAVLMTTKIHQRFDTNIAVTDIFKKPTIREIASLIDAFAWTDNPKIDRRRKREDVLL